MWHTHCIGTHYRMILDATLMLILSMSGADLAPANSATDGSPSLTVTVSQVEVAQHASPAAEAPAIDPMHAAAAAEGRPELVVASVKFPRGVCVDSGSSSVGQTQVDFEVCMQPAYREGAPGLNFVGRF